jgi:hypothetical protein
MEMETFDSVGARVVVAVLLAVLALCAAGALALVLSGYSWL